MATSDRRVVAVNDDRANGNTTSFEMCDHPQPLFRLVHGYNTCVMCWPARPRPDGHPFNTFSHDGYDCNDGQVTS